MATKKTTKAHKHAAGKINKAVKAKGGDTGMTDDDFAAMLASLASPQGDSDSALDFALDGE